MPDKPELKPCPFCGDDDFLRIVESLHDGARVKCRVCLAAGPLPDGQTQWDHTQAISAWNRRTPCQDQ